MIWLYNEVNQKVLNGGKAMFIIMLLIWQIKVKYAERK